MSPATRYLYYVCVTAYLGLIALTLAWEGWLAPDPHAPPGLWLIIKSLPLLVPLFGVLHGRVYTYAWAALLMLAYIAEGVVSSYAHRHEAWRLHQVLPYAATELVLALGFFVGAVFYIRRRRQETGDLPQAADR